ncbi:unnamed protein product [Sphenostylis stenocarpa]|uniref:Transmembrane protein n=1 Tax=Sphenostylis stenocarpa TaxID=92480 RepID=A0AA86SRP4_9FABA|nr:unnamed protein product [Sphenostylis stenocarpa]
MEEKRKSKLWLKKVSWPFRWKRQNLQTTIVDTVVYKILSVAEVVVLVSTLCFFYLCSSPFFICMMFNAFVAFSSRIFHRKKMLRNLRSQRRTRHGVFLCVVVSGLLLLVCVSVSLLHRRATVPHPLHDVDFDSLLSDSVHDDFIAGQENIDTIDALDVVEEEPEDTIDADADDEESFDQDPDALGLTGIAKVLLGTSLTNPVSNSLVNNVFNFLMLFF